VGWKKTIVSIEREGFAALHLSNLQFKFLNVGKREIEKEEEELQSRGKKVRRIS